MVSTWIIDESCQLYFFCFFFFLHFFLAWKIRTQNITLRMQISFNIFTVYLLLLSSSFGLWWRICNGTCKINAFFFFLFLHIWRHQQLKRIICRIHSQEQIGNNMYIGLRLTSRPRWIYSSYEQLNKTWMSV